MRTLKSLGYRSDLMMIQNIGTVREYPDVIQGITPDNPGYYWGNLLVFRETLTLASLSTWQDRFTELFKDYPDVRHIALGWDETQTCDFSPNVFQEQDLILEELDVLTSSQTTLVRPPHHREDLEIRTLQTDAEWDEATELQIQVGLEFYSEVSYRTYKVRQMQKLRMCTQQDLGHWFGAYLEGVLVADLGLFNNEDIGRFQNVETHPGYRKQGIAQTLVYEASKRALQKEPQLQLIIVAEHASPAMRMYTHVGYSVTEHQWGLWRRPLEKKKPNESLV